MYRRMALWATVLLLLSVTFLAAAASAKSILDILREKGILSEQEYKQAVDEAQEQEKKAIQKATEEGKKESKLPDWLNRTSLFGDIRFRYEGIFNSKLTNVLDNPDRHRVRIRARLGVGVDATEEVQGKLRLVTGDPNDPISTNQTLSEIFTRKPVSFDWVYITLSPWKTLGLDQLIGSAKPRFSVTFGKYPVPMFVPAGSELVFDADLSPEGITESFTVWDQPSGLLRTVKVTAVQWSIKEFGSKNATDLFDDTDAWMFGGQVQAQFAPTSDTKLTLAIADYGFQQLDAIARERNSNSALAITNSVSLFSGATRGGSPVSPTSCASPFTAAGCIAGFRGGFNILNVGAQLDVPTPWKQWPLSFFVDYAHNTKAATNDDNAVWLGVRAGRAASQGDLRFTYTFAYTETDAVLSVFSYSDFGRNGGTNVMGHFIALDYVPFPRVTLTLKNHFVNFIDRPVGFHNPTQSRFQADVVLSF